MSTAKRSSPRQRNGRRIEEFRQSAAAYSATLPRLGPAFCFSLDCTGRVLISQAQLRSFRALPRTVKIRGSLLLDLEYRENGEWVHLHVRLTEPKAGSESDFALAMHTFQQDEKEEPYFEEPIRDFLTSLAASPEATLLATADFGFPRETHKPVITFPELDSTAISVLSELPVRISGVRFRFERAPVTSLILDLGVRQIFISLGMTLKAKISPDLPGALFAQTRAIAEKLVSKEATNR